MIITLHVPAETVKRNADYFGIAGYLTSLHGVKNVVSHHDGQEMEIFTVDVRDHEVTILAHLQEISARRGWKVENNDDA